MIQTEQSHLRIAALTDPGRSGKNNEDCFAVSSYQVSSNKPIPSLLAVVSDGIGGHNAGEVAAEMAVNTVSQVVSQSEADRPVHILQQAVTTASLAIADRAQENTSLTGMGATCACAWVIGEKLYTASIGDSRIYLKRNNILRRLTTDHTWIQEALDKGVLTPDQARGHPNVHVIRRFLGSVQPLEVDVRMRMQKDESDTQARSNQGMRLVPGDVLLLCTDGLTDLVSDEEISTGIQGVDLAAEAQQLIEAANDRGGHDNITIILMAVPERQQKNRRLPIGTLLLAAFVGLLVLTAISLGIWILFRQELRSGVVPSNSTQVVATQLLTTGSASTGHIPVSPAGTL